MKTVHKRGIVVVAVLVVAAVGTVAFSLRDSPTTNTTITTGISQTTVKKSDKEIEKRYGYPVRLKIKSIDVDAKVQYVGMTNDGDLATPSNITDVGWYKLGTRPGNPGSAVLDGHFNGPKGQAGVFSKLTELKQGDKIATTDSKGRSATFAVTSIKTYSYDARPTEVFESKEEGAYLNLITCSGSWNAQQRNYSERTVVFAKKVTPES